MANERYAIVVSGERLIFTRDQIESDPGNYFATYFFGEYSESARGVRELLVEKDIQLFKLIQAHLRGYEIFPLSDSAVPNYMTNEVAVTNLLREAQFYGLQRLEERIQVHRTGFSDLVMDSGRLASSTLRNTNPPRYKFARLASGGWADNDITKDGYQAHMSRFLNNPGIQPAAVTSLNCPGYTISVCWRDNQREADFRGVLGECICALLVSNPS